MQRRIMSAADHLPSLSSVAPNVCTHGKFTICLSLFHVGLTLSLWGNLKANYRWKTTAAPRKIGATRAQDFLKDTLGTFGRRQRAHVLWKSVRSLFLQVLHILVSLDSRIDPLYTPSTTSLTLHHLAYISSLKSIYTFFPISLLPILWFDCISLIIFKSNGIEPAHRALYLANPFWSCRSDCATGYIHLSIYLCPSISMDIWTYL